MTATFDEDVAESFIKDYYKVFDENRAGLKSLYRENSMLTFETTPTQGADSITEKLTSLPFRTVRHRVDSMDVQPSREQGSALVLVTGALLVGEEQRIMSFTQSFLLLTEANSYYVFNDIFRLVYPA